MDIRNDIECVLKWHEEVIEFNNKEAFIKFLYDFFTDYFKALIVNKYREFKIIFEQHEITVSIFNKKFIARIEGSEVKFYKEVYQEKKQLGRYVFYSSYDNKHLFFDQPVNHFHPDYLIRMIEYAFEEFRTKHSLIDKLEYRPY